MNDARVLLSSDELEVVKTFLKTREEYNSLEKTKDKLSDKVKEILKNHSLDDLNVDGTELTIIKSSRKQAKRGKKDDLIAKLIDIQKGYLILSEPSIDFDTMKQEYDNGTFPKDVWDNYVTASDIVTLRVK